jgi:hypothetical protein
MNPIHALRTLENAIDDVLARERAVLTDVEAIQSSIRSIHNSIERGTSLNELGELQSRGPAVDVSIGRYEQAVRAFSNIYRITQPFLKPLDEDTPAEAQWKQAIITAILSNARLSEVTG